jgi:hypothetical protein
MIIYLTKSIICLVLELNKLFHRERRESVSESASSFIDIESSISTSELNPWNLGGSEKC